MEQDAALKIEAGLQQIERERGAQYADRMAFLGLLVAGVAIVQSSPEQAGKVLKDLTGQLICMWAAEEKDKVAFAQQLREDCRLVGLIHSVKAPH